MSVPRTHSPSEQDSLDVAEAAAVSRAQVMLTAELPEAHQAGRVADIFCRNSRRKVRRLFRELWSNDDAGKYRVGVGVLDGDQIWMEELLEGLPRARGRSRSLSSSQPTELRGLGHSGGSWRP